MFRLPDLNLFDEEENRKRREKLEQAFSRAKEEVSKRLPKPQEISQTFKKAAETVGEQRIPIAFPAIRKGPKISTVAKFTKEAAQAVPRASAKTIFTISDALKKDTKSTTKLTPTTKAEKFLFGKEPIGTFAQEGRIGSEFLQKYGVSPKVAGPAGFTGALALGAMDLTPFLGMGKKKRILYGRG